MTAPELSDAEREHEFDLGVQAGLEYWRNRASRAENELDAANARADAAEAKGYQDGYERAEKRALAAEAKLQEAWADGYNTALSMVPRHIRAALGGEVQS